MYKIVNGIKIRLSTQEEEQRTVLTEQQQLKRQEHRATKGHISYRRKAYKEAFSSSDQLDIIQKFIRAKIKSGELAPTRSIEMWLAKIKEIKETYPVGFVHVDTEDQEIE